MKKPIIRLLDTPATAQYSRNAKLRRWWRRWHRRPGSPRLQAGSPQAWAAIAVIATGLSKAGVVTGHVASQGDGVLTLPAWIQAGKAHKVRVNGTRRLYISVNGTTWKAKASDWPRLEAVALMVAALIHKG